MEKREEQDFRKYYDVIGEPIGSGGFGKVYKAKDKEKNENRAIKVMDKNKIKNEYFSIYLCEIPEEDMKSYIDSFENEIKCMKILEGKNKENINTVKFYEYFHTENEFAIVMELCDDNLTNLFRCKKKDEGLNRDEIYNILNQLNNSFRIMFENKIVHRDLKLENILLKYENGDQSKYIVKLTDYGISKQLLQVTHLTTKIGTPKLMAPEILEGNNNYNEECDLWSLGVIIYRLYFKKYPYDCEIGSGVLNLINGKKILKTIEDKELNDLVQKLLIKNPKERMNWNEYFNHSFFNKTFNNIKNNEIHMIIKIDRHDFNKDVSFLSKDRKDFDESNIILFINNKEYIYANGFQLEKERLYKIKLIIKIDVKDCSYMFSNCNKIISLDLSSFDTKNVTNMSNMFSDCSNLTSLNLSSFNTKNVTNMSNMFSNCSKITGLDLSSFETKKVTNMSNMFSNCKNITNLDLSIFDTHNVSNMKNMFSDCHNLTSLNLSSFDTKNVFNMSSMFSNCSKITSLNLSSFDTNNVSNMSNMFSGCHNVTNINLSSFSTKNVTDMSHMFSNCLNITSLNLSPFDTKNVTNMSYMFNYCQSFNSLDLSNFNANNVSNMSHMFENCKSLKSMDLSSFNPKNATDISYMFCECKLLESINLINFNSQNFTNMSYLFRECESLISLDLSEFDTKNVTDMSYMFSECRSLKSINLTSFRTNNVQYMSYMFNECESLESIDLTKFNLTNLKSMSYMFSWCLSLNSIDLSNLFINDNVKMLYLFSGCKSLKLIKLSQFKLKKRKYLDLIFNNIPDSCKIICQDFKGSNKEFVDSFNINSRNKAFPLYIKKYPKTIRFDREEIGELKENEKKIMKRTSKKITSLFSYSAFIGKNGRKNMLN